MCIYSGKKGVFTECTRLGREGGITMGEGERGRELLARSNPYLNHFFPAGIFGNISSL